MDFRTARLLGVRANRVIASAVLISGAPGRDRRGDPHDPVPARDARVRPPGHDHRARGRRRRRDEQAPLGDARRLRDRLRLGPARRRAPDRPEPVPAVGRVRPRHPRPARAARGGIHARRRRRWSGYERRARLAAARGAGRSHRGGGAAGLADRPLVADLLHQRARLGRLRRRALRLRRELRRRSRSGTSASSPSAPGRPACSSVPSEEKPATMPNLAGFLRDTTVGNVPSLADRGGGRAESSRSSRGSL